MCFFFENQNTVLAVDFTSSPFIQGAMAKLTSAHWPSVIIIFGDQYLQSVLYTDVLAGLEWYAVIAMPATVQPDSLQPDAMYYTAVIVVASIALFASVVGMAAVAYFWNTCLIQLTQPMFTMLVLLGSVLLCVLCIMLLGDNTTGVCIARPFLFNLSFTLCMAPLLVKGWIVNLKFESGEFENFTGSLLSLPRLMLMTGALVLLDAFIMCICLYAVGGPDGFGTAPITTTELTANGAFAAVTRCKYVNNFTLVEAEFVFKGLLIMFSCIFCYLNRKISGTIAGSAMLLVVVYNVAFISIAVVAVSQTLTEIDTVILIQALGICACVVVNVGLLVAPHVYSLIVVGDSDAAASVRIQMEKRAINSRLKELPVHNALVKKSRVSELLARIKECGDSVFELVDGKSAMDFALTAESDASVVLALMRIFLPFHANKEPVDPSIHCFAWAALSQSDQYVSVVQTILEENSSLCFLLANFRDAADRVVLNIASPACREIISRSTYFLKRYQITTSLSSPHYKSQTTLVHMAIDHDHADVVATVALKFFVDSHDFIRCSLSQARGKFDKKFVMDLSCHYESSTSKEMSSAFANYGFESYPYCVVMPAGNRNLNEFFMSESTDNSDFLKFTGLHLMKALDHMHSKGFIHGDVKPQNIMRYNDSWVLIDLDSSAEIGVGYSGFKLHSAYAPPELIFTDGQRVGIKAVCLDVAGRIIDTKECGYDLVLAHPSHDCWTLGEVLFQMATGLFHLFFLTDVQCLMICVDQVNRCFCQMLMTISIPINCCC